jgi:hypothetical protein
VLPEGLGKLEKIHLIGTRSRDLPACSIAMRVFQMKSIRRLGLGEYFTASVAQWFQQQPRQVFANGIHRLLLQWNAGLIAYGDYFNGLYSSQNNP